MLLDFTKDISSEIFVIYALIALTVILIVFIVVLDKKDKRKRLMTKTQELRLMDLRKTESNYTNEFKKQPLARDIELKSVVRKVLKENDEYSAYHTIKEQQINIQKTIRTEKIKAYDEEELLIDEDMYIEDDLEKTSAQIQLELLAKELEKAQATEEEKIRRFEEEQEENAIISYHELLKVCDDLYDKNEKVQYMDEGNEPINLEELRSRFQNSNSLEKRTILCEEIELLD